MTFVGKASLPRVTAWKRRVPVRFSAMKGATSANLSAQCERTPARSRCRTRATSDANHSAPGRGFPRREQDAARVAVMTASLSRHAERCATRYFAQDSRLNRNPFGFQ